MTFDIPVTLLIAHFVDDFLLQSERTAYVDEDGVHIFNLDG